MTKTRSNFLKRSLAAAGLVLVYSISFIGSSFVVATATSTSADARGRGGGGRGGGRGRGGGWARGRGRGYGRGYGYGLGFVAPAVRGCYWSRRYGRTICPY
jgi:hypothetical protein